MAQRSIISIHEKGFVIKDETGDCRVRLFNASTGDTSITSEVKCSSVFGITYNCCDVRPSIAQARNGGIGEPSLPLGRYKNGIIPLCVTETYGHTHPIPEQLRGKPKRMFAKVPMYGDQIWQVSHIPGETAWSASITDLTENAVLQNASCMPVENPSSTTPVSPPSPQPVSSTVPTGPTKNIDWRIALAIALTIALLAYIAYQKLK